MESRVERWRERENLYDTTDRTMKLVPCTTVGTSVIGSSRGAWRHIADDKKDDAGQTTPTRRTGPEGRGTRPGLHVSHWVMLHAVM